MEEREAVDVVSEWVRESKNTIVLTGAELSKESGVPDFASPSLNPPIAEFRGSREVRASYWRRVRELYPVLASAKPNAAHEALAEMESLGYLHSLFTLAVDGLHQLAGSSFVMELNSTVLWVVCTQCGKGHELSSIQDRLEKGEEVPACEACGGDVLKPEISFPGQPPSHWELREAWMRLRGCELFVAVGADLDAQPASSLPSIAKDQGGRLVIISRSESPADDYADAVIYGKSTQVLPFIVERLKEGIEYT